MHSKDSNCRISLPVHQAKGFVKVLTQVGSQQAAYIDKFLNEVGYYVRRGTETREFFKKGRVFAMLHTEPAGSIAHNNFLNDSYSIVRFGETAFSTIRRFVIVSVRQGFVYAL
jgi:hypothetical protein